jgi:hypothetical protein
MAVLNYQRVCFFSVSSHFVVKAHGDFVPVEALKDQNRHSLTPGGYGKTDASMHRAFSACDSPNLMHRASLAGWSTC